VSTPRSLPIALVAEGQRMASICNACRYCEGYCAVFPSIERRLSFAESDLAYLANLCHNCGSCYYACQYAPPHEFNLNLPRLLADVRIETYKKYAWPDPLARLFERGGVIASGVLVACMAVLLLALMLLNDSSALFAAHPDSEGAFYAVISHRTMAWSFGLVFAFVVVALFVGAVRFWRDTEEKMGDLVSPGPVAQSIGDVLQLKYLGGGGDGCTYPDERPSHARRWFHHFTFYGFMLCFAATCVATVYHYALGRPAPYPFWSAPVVLGTLGGIGLLIGPAGLLWLRRRRDPALAASRDGGMDVAFLLLLFLTALSGLALLVTRELPGMALVLAVHLAIVMALFLTLPYGKFVHAVYRFAALVRYHLERKRPLPELGSE
jgi:citrate/tricarballylate utilization protein